MRKSMLFSTTNPPMVVDEIQKLARRMRVRTSAPVGKRFSFGQSYPGWLLGEIEQKVGLEPQGYLGDRLERVKEAAFKMVDAS